MAGIIQRGSETKPSEPLNLPPGRRAWWAFPEAIAFLGGFCNRLPGRDALLASRRFQPDHCERRKVHLGRVIQPVPGFVARPHPTGVAEFAGSNLGNAGWVRAGDEPWHGL